jgi:hypothetical protein
VDFERNGNGHKAWIDASGKLLKQEDHIRALPKEISASINLNFKGYITDEMKKTDSSGTVTYEVELKSQEQNYKVLFDHKGHILEKTEEAED